MTPVDQEFTHKPEIGQYGDCQRAVIASLLDLPISEVPHFYRDEEEGGDPFWTGVVKFCRTHGYNYVSTKPDIFLWSGGAVYHEISGPSPRGNGVYHAVVGCNGKIEHDPHPDKTGLAGDPSKWKYAFLVRL